MPRELYVFDCFGTVLVSNRPRPSHHQAVAALAADLDVDSVVAKRILYPIFAQAWLPTSPAKDVEDLIALASGRENIPGDAVLDFLWRHFGNDGGQYRVPTYVLEVLDQLSELGAICRLITNCVLTPVQMDHLLEQTDLFGRFAVKMYSSSGEGKKPEATWLSSALAGDFDGRTVIGDSLLMDIEPARALGAATVHVTGETSWHDFARNLRV